MIEKRNFALLPLIPLLAMPLLLSACLGMPAGVRPVQSFELDQDDYEYAFISGPDRSYLWLLARKPVIGDEIMRRFETQARDLGFELDELIWVSHEEP